jgi:hypothetical protein
MSTFIEVIYSPQRQTCNSRRSMKSKYLTIRHELEIVFHVMCLTYQLQDMTTISVYYRVPVLVVARSKAWDCSCLACWDCGFESRWGEWMYFMCCQVEVSATGRSLVQRCPIECNPSVILKPHRLGGSSPLRLSSHGIYIYIYIYIYNLL